MKIPLVMGLVTVSVLMTVAIEESRIASLRAAWKTAENNSGAAVRAVSGAANGSKGNKETIALPARTRHLPGEKPGPALKAGDPGDESIVKTARKMWDNPAGKSMMNQGVKVAVGMMYQDFIDGMSLSKEEGDYFKNLLGKNMADQQELGMKMLGATPDEQKALTDEIAKRSSENEDEIKKFLNSDEDYKSYKDYKDRLPEHQQLDGIRTAMSNTGEPLDAETESKLADAMYRARTEAKAPDMSSPAAFDQLAKGNMVETFEKSWATQQEALRTEVGGILSQKQMAAFQDYQKQMKDMSMMGIKMAAKMMQGKTGGSQ